MMVDDVHDSTTTWRVWGPEHQTVRTQSDVIFDEACNVYASLPGDPEATTDTLGLVKEMVHLEVLERQASGNAASEVSGNAAREVRAMLQDKSAAMLQEESAVMPPVENSQGSGSLPLQTPLYSPNAVELVVLQIMAALGDGDSKLLRHLGLDCPEKLSWKGQDREGSQEAWSRGTMQKAQWSWKH